MIREWERWRSFPRTGWDDDKEEADPLIVFLGTCGEPLAMQALADRFPALPVGVKSKIVEIVTDTGVLRERVWRKETPLPPLVEALAEQLVAGALDDEAVGYGMSSTGGDFSYREPRVCDFAAIALARRWPERYAFRWSATRVERDPQIARARNVWRLAHALEPRPASERPTHGSASERPNVVAAFRWSDGLALPGVPVTVGEELTADAFVQIIARLHRELPMDCFGFAFSAERPGDRQGFVVAVQWLRGPRPEPAPYWSYHVSLTLGEEMLHGASGGRSMDSDADRTKDEHRAMARALSGDAGQPIAVYLSSWLSKN